jgi:hypothetical protein
MPWVAIAFAVRPVWNLTPLRHPLWWAALAVLLVNDNLLKGRALAPGWLTGKLSDFAFLIVAPVLLASLLPVALRGRRQIALAAVVGVYVMADLSSTASAAIVAAAARVGLSWRLWPDVTDLLALAVLPLTWRLLRPPPAPSTATRAPGPPRPRPLLESLAVALGAFACMATSQAPPSLFHPFLTNGTGGAQDVTITWLLRQVTCDQNLTELAATLNPADLDDPHRATLASGEVAALDTPPAPGMPVAGRCRNRPEPLRGIEGACVGVLVAVNMGPAALVITERAWEEHDNGHLFGCTEELPRSACQPAPDPNRKPGVDALVLHDRDGRLTFSAGSRLVMIEVDAGAIASRAPDPQGCRTVRQSFQDLLDANRACAADSDCQAVSALPVLGGSCDSHVNRTIPDESLRQLTDRWGGACTSDLDRWFTCRLQPRSGCRNGRCDQLCPGLSLPECPASCEVIAERRPVSAYVCQFGRSCRRADGTWCTCQQGQVVCAPPSLPPGCPIACLERRAAASPDPRDGGTD